MSIETSLHRYLKSLGPVNDLVGSRVSPNRSGRNAGEPRVVYELVGGNNLHDLGGRSGVDRALYQISCWAGSYETAKALAAAIRGTNDEPRLDGHRGWLGGSGAGDGGTWVQMALVQESSDDNLPPIDGSDEGLARVVLDAVLVYDS